MHYFASLLLKTCWIYTLLVIIGEIIISCYTQYKINDLLGVESEIGGAAIEAGERLFNALVSMKLSGLKVVSLTEWVIAQRVYYVIFPLTLTSLYYSYRIYRLEKPTVMKRNSLALNDYHENWKANTEAEVKRLITSEAFRVYQQKKRVVDIDEDDCDDSHDSIHAEFSKQENQIFR